ncbi:FT-interacting protein 3-like [Quercus lobata]|uniref:Multiple C2 domain-containing protein n=1 Tax=Quercus lobata TaxID=97700 RepID=A0A7N2MJD4_QUELO|nr:FT-interacting protein 3-like [Quercus lobata]
MGEIHLAVRFTRSSLPNLMHMYSQPLLPNMHYLHPLTIMRPYWLRHQATQIVSMRLGQAEPRLRKEVVQYMLDVDSNTWSLRKYKLNLSRVMSVWDWLIALKKWYDGVCNWENYSTNILLHIFYSILVLCPEFVLPAIFLCPFLIGFWYYRHRPKHPPHIDVRLSYADSVNPDELDEEFDTFPTSRPSDLLRVRYDQLRIIGGKLLKVASDVAANAERLQYLVLWRDPRATSLCMIFHLVAAIVVYFTPVQVVFLLTGFYVLRHPRLRRSGPNGFPSILSNFFRRLPAKTDCIL